MTNQDDSSIRRLAYAKGLFRIGITHFSSKTPLDIAQAILTFDNSLEMMLRVCIDTLGIRLSENSQLYFPELLRMVNERLKTTTKKVAGVGSSPIHLPEQSLIELHRARNGIQHTGIIPDISVAERYLIVTEGTLARLTQHVFQKDWQDISIALLIKNPIIRSIYSLAESKLDEREYKEAAFALIASFEFAKLIEQSRIWGSFISVKRDDCSNVNDTIKPVADYARAIEQEVEILKLGLDYKSYMKYKDISPELGPFKTPFERSKFEQPRQVLYAVKQSLGNELNLSRQRLHEWVIFGLGFVANSVFHWETVMRPSYLEFDLTTILPSTPQ